MPRKPVPRYKSINHKRYKLSSQDIGKHQASQLAKELRKNNRFFARVLKLKGSYRVYSRLNKKRRKK